MPNICSVASVLHVDCQKGRFGSSVLSGLWALRGAEDKVALCDQNVAAHLRALIQGH